MKKLLLIISVTLIGISMLSQELPTDLEINPDFVEYQNQKASGDYSIVTSDGHYMGEVPSPLTHSFDGYSSPKNGTKLVPAAYDLRTVDGGAYLSSVKNQGAEGACWAFATYAAMESYWLKQGYAEFDFSERNLAICHGFDYGPGDGGNPSMSAAYLTRMSGPILESDDPYIVPLGTTCESGFNPAAYVAESRRLSGINDTGYDADVVKQAVIDYGVIYVNLLYDGDYIDGTTDTYFYNVAGTGTNHAVALVGWDDNKVIVGGLGGAPTSNGAWIIKNSWGSGWGESGYFYVSYEDTRVLSTIAYFPSRIDYNKDSEVYHYDEFGAIGGFGYDTDDYGLIKFTASDDQEIEKLSTYVRSAGVDVSFEVYSSFNGSTLSGLLGSISAQTCDLPGYYIFDLGTPISVSTNDDFYIKVRYNGSATSPIAYERVSAGYTSSATIETGKCWISSSGGTSWLALGMGTAYERDLCIKAYASDVATLAPIADFEADNTTVLEGATVNFTDLSDEIPDTWDWTIDGATPSTSTDKNPTVVYNTAGLYDVTLSAENSFGSDDLINTDYITVYEPSTNCAYIDNVETGDNLVHYTTGGDPWTGINGNNYREFAEFFDSHTNNIVSGAKLYVKYATVLSTNAIITMKIWADVSGSPGAVIYSEDFDISSFTASAYNDITFATSIIVPDEFYIGYEVYVSTPQDVFSIYQVQDRNDIPSTNTAFYRKSGATWRDMQTQAGFSTALCVYPQICPTTPLVDFTTDITTVCESASVQFTEDSDQTMTSWSWDFGDSNTSTSQNPSHAYTTAGTYTVELTATNANGNSTETKTNIITVNANPTTVSVLGGTTICPGNVSLTASGGTGGTIYWQNTTSGGTNTATSSSSEVVSAAGTYYFRAQNANGCWSTEGSATVIFLPTTPAQPGAITGTDEQCPSVAGETYSIVAVTDATTYNWTAPSGWTITAGSGTNSITVSTGTIGENGDITVTAENSCGISTASTLAVRVSESTAPTLVSGASSGCSQSPYQLTVSGGVEGPGVSYQWYAGGCGSGGILSTFATLDATSVAATTTYYVRRTDACGVTTACTSFTLNITDPAPASINTDDYLWVGNWNDDWNESSNWLLYNGTTYSVPPGAPNTTSNVIFASDASCANNLAAITTNASSLCDNLTIDASASFGNTSILSVSGNWTNNGTFTAGTGTIEFVGSAIQTIDAGGSGFGNVVFNNTAGVNADINISTPLTINGVGTFNSGIVYYSGTGSLIFGNSASTTNSSGSSFVNELVSKIGSTQFVFPIGDIVTRDIGNGNQTYVVYGGIGVSPSASTTVSAEYFFAESGEDCWAHGGNMDTGLHHVSDRENWIVSSTVDLTNVSMYWDNNAHGVGDVCIHGLCDGSNSFVGSNLLVSYWNGSMWINSGVASGSSSLVHDAGYIQSSDVLPFSTKGTTIITLGSQAKETPLPIELLAYSSACKDATSVISWTTTSEINNDYFMLEKSETTKDFVQMTIVDGSGSSNEENTYTVCDREKSKTTTYYRLSQVDYNGQHTILGIVASDCYDLENDKIVFRAYPNPFTEELNIYIEAVNENKFELSIYNELGQKVFSKMLFGTDYPYENILNLSTLKSGMYNLKLQSEKQIINQKIIKE